MVLVTTLVDALDEDHTSGDKQASKEILDVI